MASECGTLNRRECELLIRVGEAFADSGARTLDELMSLIADRVLAIERHLESRLQVVFRHPRFQRLEASIRGLRRLVEVVHWENTNASQETPRSRRTNVFVLDVSAEELRSDLRASSYRQSDLYEKLYFKRFDLLIGRGTGGTGGRSMIFPFSLLIIDFELEHRDTEEAFALDLFTIERLSVIGEACFCMILLAASPRLFGLRSFANYAEVENVQSIFERPEYREWNQFREKSSSRMVGVTLPRVLVRLPYRQHFLRGFGFPFSETRRYGFDSPLWGSSAFAVAQVFVRSFITYDWFSDVCGIERESTVIPARLSPERERHRGGVMDCLPATSFSAESPGLADYPAVECMISEFDEAVLSSLGFMGVYSCSRTHLAALLTCQSVQATHRMTSQSATNNIRLSTMFNYMLCACRMAHRMKVECRNQIGQMKSVTELENDLQNWLIRFSSQRSSNVSQKKEKPFCSPGTGIRIKEDDLDPGKYDCEVSLCPHHKFDSSKSRLVLEPITLMMNIRSDNS